MPINFQCNKCNNKIVTAGKNVGSTIKCPGCQGEVLVPNPNKLSSQIIQVAGLSSMPPPKGESKVQPKSNTVPAQDTPVIQIKEPGAGTSKENVIKVVPITETVEWYYSFEKQQKGPVNEEVLRQLIERGTVAGSTKVWREGMQGWTKVSDTELKELCVMPPPPNDEPPEFQIKAPDPLPNAGTEAKANAKSKSVDWYYAVGNQRVGPVSEDVFKQLISSGAVTASTKIWHEGMPEWTKASFSELKDLFVSPKTPPPILDSPDYAQLQDIKKISFTAALVSASVALGFGVIYELVVAVDCQQWDGYSAEAFMIIYSPILIITTLFLAILHYKCWDALPVKYARTSPERAIGCLFIPFYSLYWIFVSIPSLAKGFSDFGKDNGFPIRNYSELGLGLAIMITVA